MGLACLETSEVVRQLPMVVLLEMAPNEAGSSMASSLREM